MPGRGVTLLIADAGPLIGLARIEHLGLLKDLFGVVLVPDKVFSELETNGARPGARRLARAVSDGWLVVAQVENPPPALIRESVDEGEAEAIELALERQAEDPLLFIDERRGRLVARHHGIRVIGTGGVLLAARRRGLVDRMEPVLGKLIDVGYRLSPALCRRLLELAGEDAE